MSEYPQLDRIADNAREVIARAVDEHQSSVMASLLIFEQVQRLNENIEKLTRAVHLLRGTE